MDVRGTIAIRPGFVVLRQNGPQLVHTVVVGDHYTAEREALVVVRAGVVRLPHVQLGARQRNTFRVEDAAGQLEGRTRQFIAERRALRSAGFVERTFLVVFGLDEFRRAAQRARRKEYRGAERFDEPAPRDDGDLTTSRPVDHV